MSLSGSRIVQLTTASDARRTSLALSYADLIEMHSAQLLLPGGSLGFCSAVAEVIAVNQIEDKTLMLISH